MDGYTKTIIPICIHYNPISKCLCGLLKEGNEKCYYGTKRCNTYVSNPMTVYIPKEKRNETKEV